MFEFNKVQNSIRFASSMFLTGNGENEGTDLLNQTKRSWGRSTGPKGVQEAMAYHRRRLNIRNHMLKHGKHIALPQHDIKVLSMESETDVATLTPQATYSVFEKSGNTALSSSDNFKSIHSQWRVPLGPEKLI